MGQRVPNREPGSLKLISYREPRSLKISKTGTYQEPGTEPGSSGLNFLGQPRSNWLYQEVTVFIALIVFCFSKPLTYTPEIVVKLQLLILISTGDSNNHLLYKVHLVHLFNQFYLFQIVHLNPLIVHLMDHIILHIIFHLPFHFTFHLDVHLILNLIYHLIAYNNSSKCSFKCSFNQIVNQIY